MTTPLHHVTGVLLCGGRGTRLGGLDKPLQALDGRPLAAHALDRLAAVIPAWIVSANRNRPAYAALGWPVVADRFSHAGPLAGIEAAAHVARTEWLFVCPGDAPLPDPDLPRLLYRARGESAAVHAFGDGRAQPLHLLVRTRCARALTTELEAGRRAVHAWLTALGSRSQPVAVTASTWTNVNSAAELAALRDRYLKPTR